MHEIWLPFSRHRRSSARIRTICSAPPYGLLDSLKPHDESCCSLSKSWNICKCTRLIHREHDYSYARTYLPIPSCWPSEPVSKSSFVAGESKACCSDCIISSLRSSNRSLLKSIPITPACSSPIRCAIHQSLNWKHTMSPTPLSAPRETTCRAAGRLREVNAEEDSTNRFPAAVERLHRGGPRRH